MVWFSIDEHKFGHPWEKVVEAALRKYPNPESKNVCGTDVYDRHVDKEGKLHSKRLITTVWSNPYTKWMSKLTGFDLTKTLHAIEYSIVDPKQKSYELTSCNYNFLDYIVVEEKLIYTPHPIDPNTTLLKQQWHVTCNNLSFNSFLENAMGTTMQNNAKKGRLGMEYVINQVKEEVERFTSSNAVEGIQSLASSTLQELSSFQQNIGEIGKKLEENLQEEISEFIGQSAHTKC